MNAYDWDDMNYFKNNEFKNPDKMNYSLIYALDKLRDFVGVQIKIHCDYELRSNNKSQHNFGNAVDCSASGISLLDFYLAAERFNIFTGIGIYTWWSTPGLHLDCRDIGNQYNARWGCESKGKYLKIDTDFFERNISVLMNAKMLL